MESAADASAASAGSDQKAPSTMRGSGRADRSDNLRKPSLAPSLVSSHKSVVLQRSAPAAVLRSPLALSAAHGVPGLSADRLLDAGLLQV